MSNEQYDRICKDKFNSLEKKSDTIRNELKLANRDIIAIREKLNNGITERLESTNMTVNKIEKRMWWLMGVMFTFLLGIAGAVIVAI
jgi:hypothetical protein